MRDFLVSVSINGIRFSVISVVVGCYMEELENKDEEKNEFL